MGRSEDDKIYTRCLNDLKAYMGIPPYIKHPSNNSQIYYNWCITKYGEELVQKCKLILEQEIENS